MKKLKNLLFVFAFVSVVGWGPFTFYTSSNNNATIGSNSWLTNESKIISSQAANISPDAVKTSLKAYQKARQEGLDNKEMLTIIDFTKPSRDPRLLVFDVRNQKVLFNTWVAHGQRSGDETATSFSNDRHSLKSSLGVFVTSDVYSGKHGQSLRVKGLEPGINDNAYRRNIVFHSAEYVGEDVAKSRGRLGRSWGCMAVDPNTIKPLINAIKGNTLIVAYSQDESWLKTSSFLT
ncbi:MAG TPA: murein L,D-transpeptidase catalytic domain family protein [Gammaproteobacteria bacterium]|nr:murein L,D-transpeptidase catalytic domain family protein [Gammaproteobacteria bacterium]